MPNRDDVIRRLEAVAEYHERRARELGAFDAAHTTEAMANEQEGMSVLADATRDALTLLREAWRPMSEAPAATDDLARKVLVYNPNYPPEDCIKVQLADGEWWRYCGHPGKWMPLPLPPLPKEEG